MSLFLFKDMTTSLATYECNYICRKIYILSSNCCVKFEFKIIWRMLKLFICLALLAVVLGQVK